MSRNPSQQLEELIQVWIYLVSKSVLISMHSTYWTHFIIYHNSERELEAGLKTLSTCVDLLRLP